MVEQLHPCWPRWSWLIFWIAGNDGHGDGYSSFLISTGLWKPRELLQDSQIPPQICAEGMGQQEGWEVLTVLIPPAFPES